jgi:hypothetical protein
LQRENAIDELLQSACASIKYRLRRELLGERIPPGELKSLQEQILQDEVVREILASQESEGWIGKTFHGYGSHEAGIRVLCEKGLSPHHPVLRRALQSLEENSNRIAGEMGNVGRVLDEEGFGGTAMIQAVVYAYAGLEDKSIVQAQIQMSLEGFQSVLSVSSVEEISEPYKGKLVFRPGVSWPGIYHLRLLAFTHAWRNPPNQKMVLEAIERLVALSPIPYINVRYRSQLIAPAAFAMQDFNPDLDLMTAPEWMLWFHRMELLARLGVAEKIPELRGQLEKLSALLNERGGWFSNQLNHDYFKRWGAYTGLMLEKDWKTAERRIFDLTFRSLLILAFSKNNA